MLENKIILKGVAATLTFGGVGGGVAAYVYKDNYFKKDDVYFVVKASETSSQPTSELFVENKKNYFCQITGDTTKKDDKCEIWEISFSTNKTIVSNELKESKTQLKQKASLNNTDRYFKIKIDDKFAKELTISNATKTIDLLSKKSETGQTNNKYAKLTVEFKVVNNQIVETKEKEMFLLIIANEVVKKPALVADSLGNYKCYDKETNEFAGKYEILNFSSGIEPKKPITDLSFTTNLTEITDIANIKENKYSVIKLTQIGDDVIFKNWNNKAIIFKSGNNDKKSWTFSVKAMLYGDPKNNASKGIFIFQ